MKIQYILPKSILKKGFREEELKELMEKESFYQPQSLWFTKEMIEGLIIPKVIKETLKKVK